MILSEHLISGLVTGTAILVITSQFKHLFGLSLPKHSGSLKVIYVSDDRPMKSLMKRADVYEYFLLADYIGCDR